MTEKVDAGKVIEKAEAGKELSPAEERAYNKAVQQANEEKGYEPFQWSGVTQYRILGESDRTFHTEREAAEWVMRARVYQNLTGA